MLSVCPVIRVLSPLNGADIIFPKKPNIPPNIFLKNPATGSITFSFILAKKGFTKSAVNEPVSLSPSPVKLPSILVAVFDIKSFIGLNVDLSGSHTSSLNHLPIDLNPFEKKPVTFSVIFVSIPFLPDSLSPIIQVFKFDKNEPSSVPNKNFLNPFDSPAIDIASPARAALTGPINPKGVARDSIPEIPAIPPPTTRVDFKILPVFSRSSFAFLLSPNNLSNILFL